MSRPSSLKTPERPVLGVHQVTGLLDDPTQHHGQVSSASRIRMAWTRRRSLTGSSIRSKGCTARQDRGGPRPCSWFPPRRQRQAVHRQFLSAPMARGSIGRCRFEFSSSTITSWCGRDCGRCSRPRTTWRSSGEAGTAEQGLEDDPRPRARRGHPRRPPARRQRHRGVPGDPVGRAPGALPDAHVVLRRRCPVLLHHGGRIGLRPEGGRRRRPPRRHPPGQPGHVPARPRPHRRNFSTACARTRRPSPA